MSALDIAASVALIGGAALSFVAGLAVLRFPDAATRVHAATKPQVLGIVLLTIGLGLRLGSVAIIGEFVLIVLLQLFTAPVAAHLTVRQALLRGDRPTPGSPGGPLPPDDALGHPSPDPSVDGQGPTGGR
jgi:multicomponent Na+:H+ antiporter subunit G